MITDDTIYQPSGDDYVYALTRDGKLRWKFATEGVKYDLSQGFIRSDIFSRPSLQDRTLVFASRDANVYAVDVDTHQLKWKFAYDTTWAMSSTVDEGTVYVGWSINNKVNALDLATGKQKWEFNTGAHTYTTALIVGNDSYWGSADGKVYKLDKRTGALQWTYPVGSEIYSSLTSDAGSLYFGTDDGRVLALREMEKPTHKAVYIPATIPASLQGFITDAGLTPYLVDRGFERLDSPSALTQWITARATDAQTSAVVFAFALIPSAVVGVEPSTGPMRRYLEAGGKVVWSAGAPNQYKFDNAGNFLGFSPEIPRRLLEVEFLDFEDSGNYFSRSTQAGRNWGLPGSLKTSYAVLKEAAKGLTALATDEYGRVTAFVKQFNPRVGSGWVSIAPNGYGVPMKPEELKLIEHAASYTLD